MDIRVVRKYFYQRWRGYSAKNTRRRELVFLLLGAPGYSLSFGTLLRLVFIRLGRVMEDSSIISMFSDSDLGLFVKQSVTLESGDVMLDMTLQQVLPMTGCDLSQVSTYLDLKQIFGEVGVDLGTAYPDPMTAPEAFGLKLLWPGYQQDDEKYLAILIAGILVTRFERHTDNLPPFSMHLTEVGMHLKALEAVDASLAWSLPILKTDGLRLARFLSKTDTAKYFSVFDSPCHHSDKVVSLNTPALWCDAGQLWSAAESAFVAALSSTPSESESSDMSRSCSSLSEDISLPLMGEEETENFLEGLTKSCAEIAIVEESDDETCGAISPETFSPILDGETESLSECEQDVEDFENSENADPLVSKNWVGKFPKPNVLYRSLDESVSDVRIGAWVDPGSQEDPFSSENCSPNAFSSRGKSSGKSSPLSASTAGNSHVTRAVLGENTSNVLCTSNVWAGRGR